MHRHDRDRMVTRDNFAGRAQNIEELPVRPISRLVEVISSRFFVMCMLVFMSLIWASHARAFPVSG
jgi:hypothetical protein